MNNLVKLCAGSYKWWHKCQLHILQKRIRVNEITKEARKLLLELAEYNIFRVLGRKTTK